MKKGEIKSNTKKLWRHLPYILDMEKNPRPICLVLHVTSKCNLDCDFCYIKNRDRNQELDYDKLIKFIDVIKPKSVQLTGGEPCLYPYINTLIMYLQSHNIKIGMLTNGEYLKYVTARLKYLDWLRISINSYIDTDKKFSDPREPEKLGYIYIHHSKSPHSWELRKKLAKFIANHRGSYLKVVQDVFNPPVNTILGYMDERIKIQKFRLPQHYKGKCYMGFLKPYLNADGLVYRCNSLVDPKLRIRDKTKAVSNIDRPQDLLTYHLFGDEIMNCERCGLWDRNEFINYIKEKEVEDEDFL